MNRKFFIAWIAVFVVWMLGDFAIHATLLHDDYAALPQLYRSEADSQPFFPLMLLAHVLMAGAFAWIYARGQEPKPWLGQGLRFGAAVALLNVVPHYIIYYVVQPLPQSLVVKQIGFGAVLMLLLGAVAAFVQKPRGA
jgi:hypothetical protein